MKPTFSPNITDYYHPCSPPLRMGVELLNPLEATLSSTLALFMTGGSALPNGSQ